MIIWFLYNKDSIEYAVSDISDLSVNFLVPPPGPGVDCWKCQRRALCGLQLESGGVLWWTSVVGSDSVTWLKSHFLFSHNGPAASDSSRQRPWDGSLLSVCSLGWWWWCEDIHLLGQDDVLAVWGGIEPSVAKCCNLRTCQGLPCRTE